MVFWSRERGAPTPLAAGSAPSHTQSPPHSRSPHSPSPSGSPHLSALPQPQRPAAPRSPEGHPCSAAVPSPFQPLLPTPLGPCPPPCSSQSGFTGCCSTGDSLFLLLWGLPHSSWIAGSSPWRGARWHAPLHVPKHPASPSYLPAPNLPRRASAGRAAKPFLPSDASPGRRDGGVCSAPSPARRVCTARAQEVKPSPSTLLLLHSPWVTPAPPVCHLPSLK